MSEQVEPREAAPIAPLSILDLLVGMGAIGLGLTFHNLLEAFRPRWATNEVLAALYACLAAATVGSLPRFLARWRRGERPLLPQPGHWLLAITGVVTLLSWGTSYGMFWLFNGTGRGLAGDSLENVLLYLGMYSGTLVVAGGLYGVAAWRLLPGAGSRGWRLYFGAEAALCGTQLGISLVFMAGIAELLDGAWGGGPFSWLLPLASAASQVVQGADFFLLSLVGAWDWRSGVGRDWLHWAGVGLLWLLSVGSLLSSLLPLLG